MYAHKFMAVVVAGLATTVLALAPVTAEAQAPPSTTVKKKPAQVAVVTHPAARLTVRKRSFLDPGTETKARAEHYQDYAFPPGDSFSRFQNDYNITTIRNPFPSCFDLAGFCR